MDKRYSLTIIVFCDYYLSLRLVTYICGESLAGCVAEQVFHHIHVVLLGSHVQRGEPSALQHTTHIICHTICLLCILTVYKN